VLALGDSLGLVQVFDAQALPMDTLSDLHRNYEGISNLHTPVPATAIALSGDGSTLATGDESGRVILWDAENGEWQQILQPADQEIRALAWSPDGQLLAVGLPFEIVLWDLNAGEPLNRLALNDNSQVGLTALDWAPSGERLAIGFARQGTVWIWPFRSEEGTEATVIPANFQVRELAYSDSYLAIATSDEVIVVEPERGSQVSLLESSTIRETRMAMSLLVDEPLQGERMTGVDWSLDGGTLAYTTSSGVIELLHVPENRVEQVASHHHQGQTPEEIIAASMAAPRWSPDGTRLAAGFRDGFVRLWDVETGAELASWNAYEDAAVDLVWSPDGARLYTRSEGGDVRVLRLP
jgi:WD40 repeat protein